MRTVRHRKERLKMVELGHESRPVVRLILGTWGGTGW